MVNALAPRKSTWDVAPRSAMLQAFESFYRDQPSNLCGTTSMSAALTALGYPASVKDVFAMSGASLEASLACGASLGDLHEIAHAYIQKRGLPLKAEAVFMDSLTQQDQELEEAVWKELKRQTSSADGVTVLHFNVDIAHGTKGLGGGHFALLASTTTRSCGPTGERCVVIADVNPRKYLPYWILPVKRLIAAMQSVDEGTASKRSRGFLRISRKVSEASAFDPVSVKQPAGGYLAGIAKSSGTVWQLSGVDLLKRAIRDLTGVEVKAETFFELRYMDLNRLSRGFTLSELFMCAIELVGSLGQRVHTECFHMQAFDESGAASWRAEQTPSMERFREVRKTLATKLGSTLQDKHLDVLAQLELDRPFFESRRVRFLMQTSDGAYAELRPAKVEGQATAQVQPFSSKEAQDWSIQQVVAVMEERNATAERQRGFLRLHSQDVPTLSLPTESMPLYMASTIVAGSEMDVESMVSFAAPIEEGCEERVFIFGYGSLISQQSRAATGQSSTKGPSIYVTIDGLERAWNYSEEPRAGGPGPGTFVGITEKRGAKCNGIVFQVDPCDLPAFDEREMQYDRVQLLASSVKRLDGSPLVTSDDDGTTKVYAYVNPAPKPPSAARPILQSYVDVCLLGLLEVSREFAIEWVRTTVGWTASLWSDDRAKPRYARASPAAKLRRGEIDDLLAAALPSSISLASRRSPQDLDREGRDSMTKVASRAGKKSALSPKPSLRNAVSIDCGDQFRALLEHEENLMDLFLEGSAEWVTCVVDDVHALMSDFEQAMVFMRAQQVGRNRILEGPFGPTCKVYMDYTASGQSLLFVTQYMHWIKQMFANAHTEDSATGNFMTEGMENALKCIDRCVNAKDNFVSICVGTGCTGAIQRLQQILGIYVPPASWTKLASLVDPRANWDKPDGKVRAKFILAYPAGPDGNPNVALDDHAPNWLKAREAVKANLRERGQLPLVIVGGYEHHSNELSWRDGLCDFMRVPLTKDFEFDYATLAAWLPRLRAASPGRLVIGSFSDCSNVTGMRTDIKRLSALLRRYNCLFFIDYAASGPYTRIDCNPPDDEGSFDACFVSPHKFMGGEGSCGLLLLRKSLYEGKLPPTFGGGGTVKFVTQDFHAYSDDIIERENAGTPGVLQIMQTAMAFEVKEVLKPERIEEKEQTLLKDFFRWLKERFSKEVVVYGNQDPTKRHPIVSFNIVAPHALHPRFVTCLLSDLFGIQTRAGCSCAGPHGQDLFGLTSEEITRSMGFIVGGDLNEDDEPGIYSTKPGWCRFNLHYTLDRIDVWYFKQALTFVIQHGYRFLSVYNMDLMTGSWVYEAPKGGLGLGGKSTRLQTLHGAFAGGDGQPEGHHMGAQDHTFGLEAALAGASSRMIADSDREEMLQQQLDRAQHLLQQLPPMEVAKPAAPYPEVSFGGRTFFEVGTTRNAEGLQKAVEVMNRQQANAGERKALTPGKDVGASPLTLIVDTMSDPAARDAPAIDPDLKLKQVVPAWEGPTTMKPLFEVSADKAAQKGQQRIGLEFKDVGHIVEKGTVLTGKRPKMILKDVSGHCKPGEVLFLMGPSGSGKTTLLDCLGGRTARVPLGEILFDGVPGTDKMRKSFVRYCMQDPAFHEALTVQETLWIAARLCCDSMVEARRRVDWTIASLGLQGCRDTKVGGMIFRGISGGQRKRLGIGEQDEGLVFNCFILVLMALVYRVAATAWQSIFHTGLK